MVVWGVGVYFGSIIIMNGQGVFIGNPHITNQGVMFNYFVGGGKPNKNNPGIRSGVYPH